MLLMGGQRRVGPCFLTLVCCSLFYSSARSGPSGLLRVNHSLVRNVVRPGDVAIDATCGNGWDSLFLAHLLFPHARSRLVCVDLQEDSIKATRERLSGLVKTEGTDIEFIQGCHSTSLPADLQPGSVSAFLMNLGYLPGPDSNKRLTTRAQTTLSALQVALPLLRNDGLATIMAYRHDVEAEAELESLRNFASGLDLRLWDVNAHHGLQASAPATGPVLFSIRRRA
jgi:hypothetical protein